MKQVKLKSGKKIKVKPLTPKKALQLRKSINVNVFTRPLYEWDLDQIEALLRECIVDVDDETIDAILEDWDDFVKVLETIFPQIPSFRPRGRPTPRGNR